MTTALKLLAPCLMMTLATGPAIADDLDVEVIGPSNRSSVSITDLNYHFSANQRSNLDGLVEGSFKQSLNVFAVSGIWALSPQLNLTWSLPYSTHNSMTNVWQGNVQELGQTGVGGALGISAAFVGDDKAAQGFKLTGYAGSNKFNGENAVYFGMLQPQYKLSEQFTLASNVGLQHQSNAGSSEILALNLVWHAAPDVTIIPSASVAHYEPANGYAGFHTFGLGLSMTYHLDREWAISAGANYANQSDQLTTRYVNDFTSASYYSVTAGVRYLF